MTNPLPHAFPPEIVARLPELVEGKVCAKCNGEAYLFLRLEEIAGQTTPVVRECRDCQGTGRVYETVVTVERMEQPLKGMEFHRIVLDSIAQFQRPKPHGGIGLQEIPLPYRVGEVRAVAEEWDTVRESDDGEDDGEQVPQLRSKVRVDFGNHPMLACIHPYPADTMPDELAHLCKYRGRVVGVEVKRAQQMSYNEMIEAGVWPSREEIAKWTPEQFRDWSFPQHKRNEYVALVSWRMEVAG